MRRCEMRWGLKGRGLPFLLVVILSVSAMAQVATTTVADTIYRADGSVASGTVIISWPAFTTAAGQTVPGGSTSVVIGSGGSLSVQLTPNDGATPSGTYYTAVYHLDNGNVTREYWVVPVSASAVTVSAIRSNVVPASVALQSATKSYVDTAIASALTGQVVDGSSLPFLSKSGDAMNGPLALAADPISGRQAATKHYVDLSVSSVTTGMAQKVSISPSDNQIISQPAGTQLRTNALNGSLYASHYTTGRGNNGIANALTSTDCASGCDIKAERTYASNERSTPSTWNSSLSGGTHVEDMRAGERHDAYFNPVNVNTSGLDAGQVIDVTSTRSAASVFQQTQSAIPASLGLLINHQGLTGGSNLFPESIESGVPYFKDTYSALSVNGTYNTPGQHVLAPHSIDCYGVGDCLIGSQFLRASGGFRDEADEGTHPFDLQVQEDTRVFQGFCSTGCTTGSTTVGINVSSAAGTQGEGRYLIDKSPAKVISTGQLLYGAARAGADPGATAHFTGTSFPVSVFLATSDAIRSQAADIAAGTVTVGISTSGNPAVYATNTSALPAKSGVACVADRAATQAPSNYEMANYSVIDGTHLQMTLNKVHLAGATIAVGGLCGYGLEQTVDTADGIRQVFPVIGSYSATDLYYASGQTPIVGVMGLTSAFFNVSQQIASAVRSGNVVTLTTSTNVPTEVSGLTMNVAGVSDPSFNGSYQVTLTGPNTITYSQQGADGSSFGGTISKLTGGFALYPMAEVLGVFNNATKLVDGQLTLAPNTVAWAANDPVEEPHYFQEEVQADIEFVGQTTPRPAVYGVAGVQYQRNVGPGMRGWVVENAAPVSNYLGNGGTHSVPDAAFQAIGPWRRTMEMQAGEESVFQVHCNTRGCGRWNSTYNLFQLDSNGLSGFVTYAPQTSTLGITVNGAGYAFSPQAFSANTIVANNVTANSAAIKGGSIQGVTAQLAGLTVNGSTRTTGGTTIFGSGDALLSGPQAESYLQALATGQNNAGVFVSRASTGAFASLDLVTGAVGNVGWSLQMQPNSTDFTLLDRATGMNLMTCKTGGNCRFPNGVTASNFNGVLSGATGAIGGTALAAGTCATGSVGVAGASVGAPVAVSATDGSMPSGLTTLSAAVTSGGNVTVQVCAVSATTPPARSYNVRVLQ